MRNDNIAGIDRRLYYQELYRQLPMKTILKDLTEEEIDLLQMRVLEQRSTKEIADLLGKNVDDVRWEWNKLSMKLRQRARSVVKDPPTFL